MQSVVKFCHKKDCLRKGGWKSEIPLPMLGKKFVSSTDTTDTIYFLFTLKTSAYYTIYKHTIKTQNLTFLSLVFGTKNSC